ACTIAHEGSHDSKSFVLIALYLAALAAFFTGCSAPTESQDGGAADSAQDAASHAPCARHVDCDDGSFCNGTERCVPGDPTADARGCVLGVAPCDDEEECMEEADACLPRSCEEPDTDGDGHVSAHCGGDDCDDSDGNRYPGNAETCDARD